MGNWVWWIAATRTSPAVCGSPLQKGILLNSPSLEGIFKGASFVIVHCSFLIFHQEA